MRRTRRCVPCGNTIPEPGYIVCKECWSRIPAEKKRELASIQREHGADVHWAALIDAARKARR